MRVTTVRVDVEQEHYIQTTFGARVRAVRERDEDFVFNFTVEYDPAQPPMMRRVHLLDDEAYVPDGAEFVGSREYSPGIWYHLYVGRDEKPTQQ